MKRAWELMNDQIAKEVRDGKEYCGYDRVGVFSCLIAALWPLFYILWPLSRKDTFYVGGTVYQALHRVVEQKEGELWSLD